MQNENSGKTYFYWQPHRGTSAAEKAERIPFEPTEPQFWAFVGKRQSMKPPINTLAEMIAKYRESARYTNLKPVSQRDYDRYLNELEVRLGDHAPQDIVPQVVLSIHDSLSATPVTANHMLSVIRTLFAWGVPNNWAAVNPAREIEPYEIDSDGAAPWPMDTIQLGLENCRWEVAMFIALAYYTGQRTADVLAMRLSSIDSGMISIKQSKTGKSLVIPIHKDLSPYITEARRRGFMMLVPGPRGRQLDTNQWRALWTREMAKEPQGAIRAAGLTPHGLRKSAVVALLGRLPSPSGVLDHRPVNDHCRALRRAARSKNGWLWKQWPSGKQQAIEFTNAGESGLKWALFLQTDGRILRGYTALPLNYPPTGSVPWQALVCPRFPAPQWLRPCQIAHGQAASTIANIPEPHRQPTIKDISLA